MFRKIVLVATAAAILFGAASSPTLAKGKSVEEPIYFTLATGEM
jgi:hypothetical protein